MPKIAVYTMAKNEAGNVARFVETTRGADCVVVTDTGSTDGTPDLLRDAGVAVHSARILPWRFDTATNVALAHVPDDVEVCVKLDLDEVLFTTDGAPWREEIERSGGTEEELAGGCATGILPVLSQPSLARRSGESVSAC
jgi:glycosyltransferase involved in cell wall biosynthesis